MTTPPDPEYRDRKTGLIVFGIAEILIGSLCALAIPLALIGQILSRRSPNAPHMQVLPILAVYTLLAVTFIWLGIGSTLARRWARALLLCMSAVGLCGGVIGCVVLAFVMPRMFDAIAQNSPQPMQPSAVALMKTVAMSVIFVIYIVIPGALFLFYRSPHVKRTCEVHDPVERWTDRCPLPVLALSLLMALGCVIFLAMLGGSRGFPMFGVAVSGAPRFIALVVLSVVLLFLSRGLYRLRRGAWWGAMAMVVVSFVSNIMTFWGSDVGALYAKMGLDPRAAALAGRLSSMTTFKWVLPLSVVPYLIWLLCIRRYFEAREAPPVLTDGAPPPL
jgi:hypothetical protein